MRARGLRGKIAAIVNNHGRGILLAAGGAAVISFDGLLIRFQALSPAGVTFWRGLLTGVAFALVALAARATHRRAVGKAPLRQWGPVMALAGLMVLGTLTWVFSLTHTTVAHTLVIVSASPIVTAVLGRFLLQEHLPVRTWLAGLAALVGVLIVVAGSWNGGDAQGDLWALANTGVLALMLIFLRRFQKVDVVVAISISGFVTAVLVAPWGAQIGDAGSMAAAAVDGLLIVPGGLLMITLAPRYLPAAEVGLLLLLETILAPLWVLLVLGEQLTAQVVLSAAIILGAIAVHSVLDLRGPRLGPADPLET
jgi:drug/metabolite transporter (DMT)-like permease